MKIWPAPTLPRRGESGRVAPPPWHTAVLLCVGYYLGARIGFALTLAPEPVSTLWPPNAILLAALLLTPPGSWWLLLLAALPAHLLVELQAGVPLPMVLGWFVSNCSEALIGASIVRRFDRGLLRLDSIRRVTIFVLGAALLASFVSSFLDAAFVTLIGWGKSGYWAVWRTRFVSNLLATLTLVPVIVAGAAGGFAALRAAPLRRYLEAGLLGTGLVATCLWVFAGQAAGPSTTPALLYAPLPLLLWAAMRFGPAETSACLLVFAVMAIWGATRGYGPFVTSSPADNALSMQLFLIVIAIPLMTLAAVIEERRQAEREARRNAERLEVALIALQESEARFRNVFEMGIVPMAFWHANGRITEANDAFLRLTGCSRAELEAGEVRWDRMTPPEFRDRDQRAIQELARLGRCTPFEKEYVRPDGRRVPILIGEGLLGPDHGICACVDLTERKRAERELEERLRFEQLVSDLCASFATAPAARADELIAHWLGRLGGLLQVDQVSVYLTPAAAGRSKLAYSWRAGDRNSLPTRENRRSASRRDPTTLHLPLEVNGTPLGVLAFNNREDRPLPDELVRRLHLVAQIFANVIARKQIEGEMRQVEALNAAVLASLPGMVAIVDRTGTIVRANEEWERHAREHPAGFDRATVSHNLLAICGDATQAGDDTATEVHGGLTAVLDGARNRFSVTYPRLRPSSEAHWYEMWIERLARREGGAVITRIDCTARKNAELEASRNRAELAHVVRVATMGELATSLAHELNQPLTAILSNAQAGRRLLVSDEPDLGEVREILADITENDRRAGEVVRRMRGLLRKGELEMSLVDLNVLVRDVVRLVGNDLLLRRATASLDLDGRRPQVQGDRVQLQQVLLNLILNGLEAMSETERARRRLTIRTRLRDEPTVEVAVHDGGTGIPADRLDQVFEAFYTTKQDGLGMGLSISRSIVQAHGGSIWASNNPEGGANVGFSLPLARS